MYNKRKLYDKEIQKSLSTLSINVDGNNFDSIKKKNYTHIGIDYWTWIDLIAHLETTFSKDLAETTDKFKIETIDDVIEALYNAPDIKNLYNN